MSRDDDRFEELYNIWAATEWSEEDPLKLVRLARELTVVRPSSADAWDALATSIMGVLFPPGKELLDKEKDNLKENPLFWEMVDAFGKEMELDADEPSAPWNRAISFEKVGLYEHAYKNYMRVAEIERKIPPISEPFAVYIDLFLAGQAAYNYGDYNKAVEALKNAISEGGSEESEIWYYLAKSLEKLGNPSESIEAYEKAASLNPGEYEKEYLFAKKRLQR